jgi:dUTPase
MSFKVALAHQNAKVPTMAVPGSAGFDLHSAVECTIQQGERMMIQTGVVLQFPGANCSAKPEAFKKASPKFG